MTDKAMRQLQEGLGIVTVCISTEKDKKEGELVVLSQVNGIRSMSVEEIASMIKPVTYNSQKAVYVPQSHVEL